MEPRFPTRQCGPFKYDAYLGFGVRDLAKMNLLRRKLEQRNILCYPKYDPADCQQSTSTMIREGIARSKKCLLYVSRLFFNDQSFKYEVAEVQHKAKRFSRDMVVIIKHPEVDMPSELKDHCKKVICAVLDDSTLTNPEFLGSLANALLTGSTCTCLCIDKHLD